MNIEIRDSLTLNGDKEYNVISKITVDGEIHYLLVEKLGGHERDIKFCKEHEGANLEIITDEEYNAELLPLFIQEAMKHVTTEEYELLKELFGN